MRGLRAYLLTVKITVEIPFAEAIRLRALVTKLKANTPDTEALREELKKHGVDLSKIELS
jgi:hypothetical protein